MTYPTIEEVKARTRFKEDWKAHGAIETLKWLEEGAPHKLDGLDGDFEFNMSKYVQRRRNDCGTTCCIAGAIRQFGSEIPQFPEDHPDYEFYKVNMTASELEREFGIVDGGKSKDELFNLFYAWSENASYSLFNITAKQAAVVLRKYLETGIVDWDSVF